MDYTAIILTIGIIFAASFFSTVSGFGFALVAMPVLTLVMSVKAAVIFVLLLHLVLRAITMYRVREGYDKATVILTTLGSVVGMLPGSWVLKVLPAAQLEVFLGAVLVVATVLLSLQFTLPIKNKPCGRFAAGILSGFFGASTSVSGPPLVLYFINEKLPKDVMRANMIWFFGLSGFLTVLVNYFYGNVSGTIDWSLLLYTIPVMLLAIWLGEKFFYRLNQHLFRKLALAVVLVGALMLLWSGWQNL